MLEGGGDDDGNGVIYRNQRLDKREKETREEKTEKKGERECKLV